MEEGKLPYEVKTEPMFLYFIFWPELHPSFSLQYLPRHEEATIRLLRLCTPPSSWGGVSGFFDMSLEDKVRVLKGESISLGSFIWDVWDMLGSGKFSWMAVE